MTARAVHASIRDLATKAEHLADIFDLRPELIPPDDYHDLDRAHALLDRFANQIRHTTEGRT